MYGSDLAEIYDTLYAAGVGKDYVQEAATLVEAIRSRQPAAASLLDVACGTGEHLRHLRESFEQITGVELSEPMRRIAAAKLPGVPIYAGDMRTFALDTRFDAVTCLFSSIGYVADGAELRAAMTRMAAHLNPGGVLVVDTWLRPDQWIDGFVGQDVAEDGERTIMRMSYSTRTGRIARMHMHYLVGMRGAGVRYFQDEHTLALFTGEEYEQAMLEAGLTGIERAANGPAGRDRLVGVRRAG